MEIARPREIRGTSAAGHERHATSLTFRFSRPSVSPFAHPVRYHRTRLGWSRRIKLSRTPSDTRTPLGQ
jgi:hypothetical protein